MTNTALEPPTTAFSEQVRRRFSRRSSSYDQQAQLQRAIAWRLAHRIGRLPIAEGPCADLGAGTGLLGQALRDQPPATDAPKPGGVAPRSLLQLDLCADLLAHNPLPQQRPWNLEWGLPADLAGAALLTSSFALQWLAEPVRHVQGWCRSLRPGGWLVLAVPTAASFPQWRQAAARAGVPYTALPLPDADALAGIAAAELILERPQRLRFQRPYGSGRHFLGQLSRLGAGASPHAPLSAGQLRRLLRAWPADGVVSWEVLILVGRRQP